MKTVTTPDGELKLDIPRGRQATFEPQLVGKYQPRLPGFGDHIISMYARCMSVREIPTRATKVLTPTAGGIIEDLPTDGKCSASEVLSTR